MQYVGVDGCPDGWVAVTYSESGFEGAKFYEDIATLWADNADATRILIDVPIGLREESNAPRVCDSEARQRLSPLRHTSVFPTPVRPAARKDSYEPAKRKQERLTDGSLNTQTWGITPKIDDVDRFLLRTDTARGVLREAHPEVCFWAFSGGPMAHSKTTEPAQGFWERVMVLRERDENIVDRLRVARRSVTDEHASLDDIVDAFVLALTALGDAAELRTLPREPERDPKGLPMEIVYRLVNTD